MQVVLHPLRRRGRDLLLLKRPGNPQVSGIRQVQAAGAGALGIVVLGRPGTSQVIDAPGLPGCFPRFRFFASARSAARRCFRGGFFPGRSSELGGIEEFPLFRDPDRSAAASCSRRSATTASSTAIRSACSRISASRGSRRRHISHSPESSPKPRSATTATPRPPPKRDQRSPTATASPRT